MNVWNKILFDLKEERKTTFFYKTFVYQHIPIVCKEKFIKLGPLHLYEKYIKKKFYCETVIFFLAKTGKNVLQIGKINRIGYFRIALAYLIPSAPPYDSFFTII